MEKRLGLDQIRNIPNWVRKLSAVETQIRAHPPREYPDPSSYRVIPLEVLELRRLSQDELRERKTDVRYMGQPK